MSYAVHYELCCTIMSYAVPLWAMLYPCEICCSSILWAMLYPYELGYAVRVRYPMSYTLMSYAVPLWARVYCNLMNYAVPFWATMLYPVELRFILSRNAASCWSTSHPEFRNAGLSRILSVLYRNGKQCRCQNQSGNGLRCRMPKCRCWRHRPLDADAQLCGCLYSDKCLSSWYRNRYRYRPTLPVLIPLVLSCDKSALFQLYQHKV